MHGGPITKILDTKAQVIFPDRQYFLCVSHIIASIIKECLYMTHWKGATGNLSLVLLDFTCADFNLYHLTIINCNHEYNIFLKSPNPFSRSSSLR